MPVRLYFKEAGRESGGNHDYFFGVVPELPKLIERHGFIVVAPLGSGR